ncbi:acetate and sugar kinases/Hsc70/actin family protein [Candidatus Methanoperedens nitratireducens]|uniref:2-hydroxyglutaryl-CoA dehydratase n=1 Tax=Candidatus Methanoperedens nitratireducens TaxID=1392998 RepID=A0A284VNZ5_9EURY|nr:hypothetical protein [Candidatus Methanoperedens nitroreducens]SNQ61010.1 hypothetical protein MNV_220004 [Candidatus Methanoperedens nitroreducens]
MGKIFVGIDLGSTTVKAVAVNGKVIASAIKPTGANPRKTGEVVLEQVLAGSRGDARKLLQRVTGGYHFLPMKS